ncbi:MAG: ATPase [Flavobacteriales bacterium]|nr:ATPase [Flavobacteriales bacterium]|tara:strand:- start:1370 stop:2644 length:1275 start_codon:yes stop_codon:yes gene_type:complete
MERLAKSVLIDWKNKPTRKPLIIKGARQVGKTWLMKTFAEEEFDDYVYINFERDVQLQTIFTQDYDLKRILLALEIQSGKEITPKKTLVILDEIQEAKGGLTSLKYFNEELPNLHIVAAGSLLGLSIHEKQSFPVGKVEFLNLNPFSFEEFLLAKNHQKLIQLIKGREWELIKTFKSKYISLLKQYYFVGGMPEAVDAFIQNENFKEVREIQNNILNAYELDFSKYASPNVVPKIKMIWNSILPQLSKENKKYIYGLLKQGARAKEYEDALLWLENYGLIKRVSRITKPHFPLKSYTDSKAFKLYIHDVGLLNAMGNVDEKILLEPSKMFSEFKGSLTEQFVLQELTAKGVTGYYWSENTAELDFVIEKENSIVGMEVKAEENLKAKSLKVFNAKYSDTSCIRFSLSDYRKEDWLVNIPLYAIS